MERKMPVKLPGLPDWWKYWIQLGEELRHFSTNTKHRNVTVATVPDRGFAAALTAVGWLGNTSGRLS